MADQYLLPTYKRQPFNVARGEGIWLYDDQGNAYLDALSGIGVNCLGHCHPVMTKAIAEQSAKLFHVSNYYGIPSQSALAEAICRLSGMEKVFFGNSGAEANEAALKLARLHGHRKGIDEPVVIVMEGAFHGRTLATLSATANPKVQAGFEPLVPGFIRVPFNDAAAVEKALADHANAVAVLLEPVQGEGGINLPDKGYLAALRNICDQQDALLMLDEVQCGNARSGTYFAYQQEDILPDVVTTAKGLGGGLPIAAVLTAGAATPLMGPGNHGSTFGGNPLCTAAALAVVGELEKLLPGINQRADKLCTKLAEKLSSFSFYQGTRYLGLMIGIQLANDCVELVDLAREEGLLINVTAGSVIRLLPPLNISDDEIDELCERLTRAVTRFANSGGAA